MKAIVVVDKFWGIGKNNDLLFSLKEDMKHFRAQTTGKVIIMGKNTLDSLPNGKPLKNRTSFILGASKSDEYTAVNNLDELFTALKGYSSDEIFVAGGATVYKTMLQYCDTAIVTKVDSDGQAEVFFPNLDQDENWHCTQQSDPIQDGDYTIYFCEYKRISN